MDRSLKERLIGAAVLVAIAIVVIPELLSGPSRESPDRAIDAPDETSAGLKTYTIDLSRTGQSPAVVEDAPAGTQVSEPPPVAVATREPAPEAAAETPVGKTAPSPAPAPARTETTAAASAASSAQTAPPAQRPAATQTARTAAPAAAAGEWAVQVGSFSTRKAADDVAAQFEKRGYQSFVTQFRTGGRTLHRVRLGPVANREQADTMVRKLKGEGTTATVVANR